MPGAYRASVSGYTSVSIARRYAVTGYVKNLADGTVELVVEAERQPLEEFLSEIEQYFSEKIVECNCTDWGSNASFQDFAVRY